MPSLNYDLLLNHEQKYPLSCVPSSIEMILKLEKIVNKDYYELQNRAGNVAIGGNQFNGNKYPDEFPILTFTQKFTNPRDNNFPFDDLFRTIDEELAKNHYVIVTLKPDRVNFHNYILFDHCHDNEYIAITKFFNKPPSWENKVKEIIRSIQGTDIITYSLENRNEYVRKILESSSNMSLASTSMSSLTSESSNTSNSAADTIVVSPIHQNQQNILL